MILHWPQIVMAALLLIQLGGRITYDITRNSGIGLTATVILFSIPAYILWAGGFWTGGQ